MPRQSSLIPYENEIVALRRRKPPTPYSQIAGLLREKYHITVNREGIFKFIKNRAKGSKPCKYAWAIELENTNDQPIIKTPSLQKTPVLLTPKPSVSDKQPVDSQLDEFFNMPFSETYNLTRVSPEEAAARLKKLEEKEKLVSFEYEPKAKDVF